MKVIRGRRYANVSDDVHLGKNVKVHEFTNLYGCHIGDDSQVGAFVEIQKGAWIGKRVRIQSHTFICQGVRIEDDVFVGHHVTFINDRYPRSKTARNRSWKLEKVTVKKGASIGSGSTILCGVTIGEKAMVGAGSVVVSHVAPRAVVVGNPARIILKLTKRR